MPSPKIVMFAGPNGSGKSTVTANFQALPNFPTNYANADEIADRVTLVDNTELPIECTQAWQGTVQRTVAACPNWVEVAIDAVGARKISRETWQQWANAEGLQILAANAWSGSYRGEILRMDDRFLLQAVGETVVLHDRLGACN